MIPFDSLISSDFESSQVFKIEGRRVQGSNVVLPGLATVAGFGFKLNNYCHGVIGLCQCHHCHGVDALLFRF